MATCKNCSKSIEVKQGRRPREFCDNNQKCRNEWFRKNKKAKTQPKTVKLPDDYLSWENVGILKSDGTIEELKDITQLSEHFQIAVRGLTELKNDVKISNTASKKIAESATIPRLEGENSLDYRIRCEELRAK